MDRARGQADGGEAALSAPGTYALVLENACASRVRVGALGRVAIESGYLVYVGSAFGPGGLEGRLRHHLRPVRRAHWHIDYLRREAVLLGVWLARGPRALEHRWAARLAATPRVSSPRPGLGASDCRCESHLFWSARRPTGAWIRSSLEGGGRSEAAVEYRRAPALRRALLC